MAAAAVWLFLTACFVVVCYGLPWSVGWMLPATAAAGTLLLAAAWLAHRVIPETMPLPSRPRLWCALIVPAGLALRVAYVCWVPPVQLSDMGVYVTTASNLLAGSGYFQTEAGNGYTFAAWRPPGEAFLLAGVMALTHTKSWAPAIINLACYLASALTLYSLGARLAGRGAALVGLALFAVWPSDVMAAGLALTEIPAFCLWLVTLLALVRAQEGGPQWALVAGLALGAGTLIRPEELPVPAALLGLFLVQRAPRAAAVKNALVACAACVLVIAPWTLRNYAVLGAFVPVSTNGGDNLYRANNPAASGTYVPFTPDYPPELTAVQADEVAWDRASNAAAWKWIRGHPGQFVRLSARKLAYMVGSDETGAYWSLKRARSTSDAAYGAALVLSNAWWWLVWMLAAVALRRRRTWLTSTTTGLCVMFFAGYSLVVHSVYQSQPRFHLPIVGPLIVIAALVFATGESQSRRSQPAPTS